ncbi:LacI family DNA-binding transcriptional regulator [Euzebya tangerina]|uniref:LacI family DNA-binding transcriptional regulator n=1 Tax=Euzebya tangerina TaxID=591198 RepID=UPI000E318B62|nr:LacI family DNA-binding transcriptional regulator [Euzebya tangerina]
MKPKTLEDLAALAGVSRATVSRVVNGGSVSERTRRRVQQVLDETGFRPNRAARTLVTGRSGVVGVVMHEEPTVLFKDAYFADLMHGISDGLAEQATGMMLWLGNRSKADTLEHIRSSGIADGIIVTAHFRDDPLVDGLRAAPIPTVLIGHRREDADASYVDIDNVEAARTVTRHLIESGRTRVGHITGRPGTVAADDRLEGYRLAMLDAGLDPDRYVAVGNYERHDGQRVAPELLERGVEAIFCVNDFVAHGAYLALQERGVDIPGDVAVAGFDDLEFAATLPPPLTTIRQDVRAVGMQAAASLLALLDDPDGAPQRVLLPTELIIRASTDGGAST